MLGIKNSKNNKLRKRLYKDLISVTEMVLGYASNALREIERNQCLYQAKLTEKIREFTGITERVVDQSTRRVIKKEKVPSEEKMVSLFESHTDIIRKDRRDTYYCHKICLTVGASDLVSDCFITKGNPADTSLMETVLRRREKVYGRFPLKVALDGGLASRENLNKAKPFKIKDVCFCLDWCTWKSLKSFHSYAWTSIITANLVTVARATRNH